MVEPSNKVYIYSPRFAAVRQVVGLAASEHLADRQRRNAAEGRCPDVRRDHGPRKAKTSRWVTRFGTGLHGAAQQARRRRMSSAVGQRGFQNSFKPYENLAVIRLGASDASEWPYLARGSNAAIAWPHTQAVQVVLERRLAMAEVKYERGAIRFTPFASRRHTESCAW